jgi:hypothetical protein
VAVVAVDFDNTIFQEDDQGNLELVPEAREALEELRSQGHHIVIHTCRTTVARELGRLTKELAWLEETLARHDVAYDEIHAGDKMIADAYVDDRAVAFRGDWSRTLSELENHLEGHSRHRRGKTG